MAGMIKEKDINNVNDNDNKNEVIGDIFKNCVNVTHVLSNKKMDQKFFNISYK